MFENTDRALKECYLNFKTIKLLDIDTIEAEAPKILNNKNFNLHMGHSLKIEKYNNF